MERVISNSKGDLARATEDLSIATEVKTQLANLRKLETDFDKAAAKLGDKFEQIKNVELREKLLNENFEPGTQEYIDEELAISSAKEEIMVDATEQFTTDKAAYDKAKQALDNIRLAKEKREEAERLAREKAEAAE